MISVDWCGKSILIVGTKQDFARRILAAFSGVSESKLLLADLDDKEMERIEGAQEFIDGVEMWIGGEDERKSHNAH